jgi:hypothetical protein
MLQPLGDMALHLGAQNQLGLEFGDGALDLQIVVGDQRRDAVFFGGGADLAGEFAVVGAQADDLEAQLFGRDAGGGDRRGWRRRR